MAAVPWWRRRSPAPGRWWPRPSCSTGRSAPRAAPFFLVVSVYSFLAAAEFWRGSGERLQNGIVLAIACSLSGALYLVRAVALAVLGEHSPAFHAFFGAEIATIQVLLLFVVSAFSLIALAQERSELALHRAATRDGLTVVFNRREFTRLATAGLRRATVDGAPAALVLIDVDHFRRINDTYGHAVGDQVLIAFAQAAAGCIRATDLLCRHGGEEFGVLLPGLSWEESVGVAERIRSVFAETVLPTQAGAVRVTASVGVAFAEPAEPDLAALFHTADQALYQAKAAGRNRVIATERRSAEAA